MLQIILAEKGYTEIDLHKTLVDLFELEVDIDGIVTNFLLDTGAASTVIDKGFAETHNLQFENTNIIGGGVGTSQLGITKRKIENFVLNGFALKDFDLYAADFSHVKDSLIKKGITNPANGVLGADILIRYKAIIDYGSNKLYLKK